MPPLSPDGTARQSLAPTRAYPPGLLELVRDYDLHEGDAYLAWQVAELAVGVTSGDRDALMLLVGRLLVAQARGGTRLPTTEDDRSLLAKLPELAGGAQGRTPLVVDGNQLYAERVHACEGRVVAVLAARLNRPGRFAKPAMAAALDDVVATGPGSPSEEQKTAVLATLSRFLGVISGGPGTGKTTTALALVRSLVRLGIAPARIALCAPTGKAASRLEDDFRTRLGLLAHPPLSDRTLLADCPKAQTLHRLLGTLHPRARFSLVTAPLLPHSAVIVDEASMIDLALMDRLLAALADDTLLFLLGDADQLPSVSAGAVFRDLGAHALRLAHGFRTDVSQSAGKQLVELAKAVRAGRANVGGELWSVRAQPDRLTHRGVELLSADHREELLRRHHSRVFADAAMRSLVDHVYAFHDGAFEVADAGRLDTLAARLARTRILAMTRQRAAGVERTNAFLHELGGGGRGTPFLPGEPVMMLRNDYERGLWNGDQGVAVRVQRPRQPVMTAVAFRSRQGWQPVDPRTMGDALSLAFALTIHKAQGSEFDEVVVLLPDSPCQLLTRELLYTAISRARSSVILCGTPETFAAGVSASENRSSGIAERLAGLVTPVRTGLDLPTGLR
jgi:exodeoxyribonuclease V alpha subunit